MLKYFRDLGEVPVEKPKTGDEDEAQELHETANVQSAISHISATDVSGTDSQTVIMAFPKMNKVIVVTGIEENKAIQMLEKAEQRGGKVYDSSTEYSAESDPLLMSSQTDVSLTQSNISAVVGGDVGESTETLNILSQPDPSGTESNISVSVGETVAESTQRVDLKGDSTTPMQGATAAEPTTSAEQDPAGQARKKSLTETSSDDPEVSVKKQYRRGHAFHK